MESTKLRKLQSEEQRTSKLLLTHTTSCNIIHLRNIAAWKSVGDVCVERKRKKMHRKRNEKEEEENEKEGSNYDNAHRI
ncbi:hypothetical protein M8J77_004034 [Diaphorina citri]|nr:hypothetical protein M8J77_004034 [Diaphorina citri]